VRILAIDPGTHLGWATDLSGRLEWGEQDFSLQRGDSPGMRFHRFNAWLREICKPCRVDIIIYEMPHMRGGAATNVLVGMTSRIEEFCAIPHQAVPTQYTGVHSATLKKFALGKGRGDKAAMIAAAVKRIGQNGHAAGAGPPVLSEHEADALWLYFYCKEVICAEH